MQISHHFTLLEATKSQIALRHGIDNTPPKELVQSIIDTAKYILEPVRVNFGKPIIPSSFYRCIALNRALHSQDTSQHVKGEAVDFEVPYVSNLDLARWIEANLDFDQLILEYYDPDDPHGGWVHASYAKAWNRNEVLTWNGSGYTPGLPEE